MLFRVIKCAAICAMAGVVTAAGVNAAATEVAGVVDAEPTSGTAGIVLDPEGNPVANASIKMFLLTPQKPEDIKIKDGHILGQPAVQQSLQKETGADGIFHVSPVAKGVGVLSVNQPPYTVKVMTMRLPDPNLRIQLENNSAAVHGIVKNASTGLPVPDARVTAIPKAGFELEVAPGITKYFSGMGHVLRAKTDATGQYIFDRLPPGTSVTLEAAAKDLVGVTESLTENTIRLKPGETATAPELLVYPGHTLTGRVIDKKTGLPIPGAQVQVGFGGGGPTLFSVASGKTMQPAISDAQGKYSLPDLKPWKGGMEELAADDKIDFMFVTATAPGYGQARFTPTAARQFDPSSLKLHHDFELQPRSR